MGSLASSADAATFTIGGTPYSTGAPSESVTAFFASPSGAQTTNVYSGYVLVTVSGSGNSFAGFFNDAFYYDAGGGLTHDADHYQLVATTDGSVFLNNTDNAYHHIVYDVDAGTEVTPDYVPAYRPDNTYTFILDLSSQIPATPAQLTFGVEDGVYTDNGGAYNVTVAQLAPVATPDSGGTLALLTMSLAGFAWAGRRFGRKA